VTVWINGVPCDQISASERTVSYGDGCFTTIRVQHRKPLLWSQHIKRLKQSVHRLRLPEPDWGGLDRQIKNLADTVDDFCVLKVALTRGQGGRGYSPHSTHSPLVIVTQSDFPNHYHQWSKQGIVIGDAEQRLSISPMLAGLKHSNRLEQVLLKQEIEKQQWDEAIVLDANDYLAEGVTANLFWQINDQLFTPRLAKSGVWGLMRQQVCNWASDTGISMHYVDAPLTALENATAIFFTNALMGVVPVRAYGIRHFSDFTTAQAINLRVFSC
jgi:4-amino-4-deoxychorismate lyase